MPDLVISKEPFVFSSRFTLSELTGIKASTISQLLECIERVPDSCIYHHTHRFLLQHQYLSPEPPNDFAYWVSEVLGEDELGEKLASIDTMQYSSITALRERIISVIGDYLKSYPLSEKKFARQGEEFYFINSISFILKTSYVANNLKEFLDIFSKITIDSIYFHMFEARIRLGKKTNDFSNWIETSIGNKKLALKISSLDPYTRTLEDLRNTIIKLIKKEIKE